MKVNILFILFISFVSGQNIILSNKLEKIKNLDTIYIKFHNNHNELSSFTIDSTYIKDKNYEYKIKKNLSLYLCYTQKDFFGKKTNKIKVINRNQIKDYKKETIDIVFFKQLYKETKFKSFYFENILKWKKIYIIDYSESEKDKIYLFPVNFCDIIY